MRYPSSQLSCSTFVQPHAGGSSYWEGMTRTPHGDERPTEEVWLVTSHLYTYNCLR